MHQEGASKIRHGSRARGRRRTRCAFGPSGGVVCSGKKLQVLDGSRLSGIPAVAAHVRDATWRLERGGMHGRTSAPARRGSGSAGTCHAIWCRTKWQVRSVWVRLNPSTGLTSLRDGSRSYGAGAHRFST
uniref:Uncharacterized protein n=1 Tax=Setaria italica TaxID=4555 RepID=K3ZAR2_SETIT